MRNLTQAAEIGLTDRVRVTLAANSSAARTSSNSRVRVVGQHFLRRHSTGKQIDDELDRVAHATNARSAVAHGWVHRDSIKTSHLDNVSPPPSSVAHGDSALRLSARLG